MQSFWSNTIEVSLAVHARNKDKIKKWTDLSGKRVFTGPLPFDVRAHLERAMAALDIKFSYVQIDLAAAGIAARVGRHRRHEHLYRRRKGAASVVGRGLARRRLGCAQSEPGRDRELKTKNFSVVEVSPDVFKRNVHVAKVIELPFYYGFHVGLDVSGGRRLPDAADHRGERRRARQVRSDVLADRQDMAGFQKRGVELSADLVPIHPGLARYMREKGVWDTSGIPRSPRCRSPSLPSPAIEQGQRTLDPCPHAATQPSIAGSSAHLARNGGRMTDTSAAVAHHPRLHLLCSRDFLLPLSVRLFLDQRGRSDAAGDDAGPGHLRAVQLNALRANELYPRLPPIANYAIAAVYVACALAVAVYMNMEYYELGTSRAGSWDPSDLFMGGSWRRWSWNIAQAPYAAVRSQHRAHPVCGLRLARARHVPSCGAELERS